MNATTALKASQRTPNRSLTCLIFLGYALTAIAAEPIVYPAQGQSYDQMAADKGVCQSWATQQTGVNPSSMAQQQPAAPTGSQGGLLKGGAKSAAIGAIAGDAGKGAAIGATAGGMGGAMRKHQAHKQQQQAQSQSQAMDTFYRAYGACLKGKGYSVE